MEICQKLREQLKQESPKADMQIVDQDGSERSRPVGYWVMKRANGKPFPSGGEQKDFLKVHV